MINKPQLRQAIIEFFSPTPEEVVSPHEPDFLQKQTLRHRSTFYVVKRRPKTTWCHGRHKRKQFRRNYCNGSVKLVWNWKGAIVFATIFFWLYYNWCNTFDLLFNRIWRTLLIFFKNVPFFAFTHQWFCFRWQWKGLWIDWNCSKVKEWHFLAVASQEN